jgi:riboflavin biosynthesis pyrimidine reductase
VIESLYTDLEFPPAPPSRPFVYLNMVSTLDGKILSGDRHEHVVDLGSKTDHLLMDRLESAADAVILGGGSARANPPTWDPKCPTRIVVSESGNLNYDAAFFRGGRSFVASSKRSTATLPDHVQRLAIGEEAFDLPALLAHLRQMGIKRLHLMGGAELNAEFFAIDAVDEFFLTLAPKVKSGRDVPTISGGEPLPRAYLRKYDLISCIPHENEVFLRYRRTR